MSTHSNLLSDIGAQIVKTASLVGAWFLTWNLPTTQAVLACLSAVGLLGYTLTNWYVLWRDKIKNYKPDAENK